jgi:hypothetical protein
MKTSPFNCSLEQVFRYEHFSGNPLSTDDPLRLFSINKWVPKILSALIDIARSLNANTTCGIFRTAADKDSVVALKNEIEENGYRMLYEALKKSQLKSKKAGMSALQALTQVKDVYLGMTFGDANECADLIKQWFRGLTDPIIPYARYAEALEAGKSSDIKQSVVIFNSLMGANQATIDFLLAFLVELLETKHVTLMDTGNLALVFCPNLLKNPDDDPMKFALNSENERRFVVSLIEAKQKGLLMKK